MCALNAFHLSGMPRLTLNRALIALFRTAALWEQTSETSQAPLPRDYTGHEETLL